MNQELKPVEEQDQIQAKEREDERLRRRKDLREWIILIVAAIALGLFLRTFVLQRNLVKGPSMEPTLIEGDQLLVQMVSKHFRVIPRGTIVTVDAKDLPTYEDYQEIFHERAPRLVKRVVGLPGEHVVIRDGTLWIDEVAVDEPYLDEDVLTVPSEPSYMDVVLADDEYFVLGDNRPHSKDSRMFGPVKRSDIIGEFLWRIYPWSKFGNVE